jgi:hypothetical protein
MPATAGSCQKISHMLAASSRRPVWATGEARHLIAQVSDEAKTKDIQDSQAEKRLPVKAALRLFEDILIPSAAGAAQIKKTSLLNLSSNQCTYDHRMSSGTSSGRRPGFDYAAESPGRSQAAGVF